jgi:hypothetical protein
MPPNLAADKDAMELQQLQKQLNPENKDKIDSVRASACSQYLEFGQTRYSFICGSPISHPSPAPLSFFQRS